MKKNFLLLILFIPLCVKGLGGSARSAILMDTDSNRILYEKNIHEVRSVASISKIMTAVVAIESGKLDDEVTVGSEINKAYGSGIYIKEGEILTLRDLLYGLMLRSGNDAALAIAHYVGGSVENFVSMMNTKAKEIGMIETTFNNPSGLDQEKGNYSSAYDMAILTSYAMTLKDYRNITSTKKYTLKTNKNVYSWINKNKLLTSYKYTTGGKTGFTEIAKRTLVSTASKDKINLVVVTLNDGNDWSDHKELFEYGFSNYTHINILTKGKINILNEKYYKYNELYIKNNYGYLLENSEKDNLVLKYKLEKKRKIKDDDKIGEVQVYLGDKKIHSEDIFVKTKVIEKKYNTFQKIRNWFNKL